MRTIKILILIIEQLMNSRTLHFMYSLIIRHFAAGAGAAAGGAKSK